MKLPRTASSLLVMSFILMLLASAMVESSGIGVKVKPFHLLHKESVRPGLRKLMRFETILDYDYAGANPKHDPPRGKRGGAIRTP